MCWLLARSVRQMWPLRTPSHDSRILLIPLKESRIEMYSLLIFRRGNVHCAWDSHLHHAVDRPLPSITLPALCRLDKTGHYLTHFRNGDRPQQKQVRTHGRKRFPAATTHYPASAGQKTSIHKDGSNDLGPSRSSVSSMETSPFNCPTRDAHALASPGMRACSGSTNPEQYLPNQRYQQKPWL
jgi:hypothetical protein